MRNLASYILIILISGLHNLSYAGEAKSFNLSGVWSNALLTPDDPRWRIEDLACARTGCSLVGFEYLQRQLRNPENENRTVKELFYEMREYEKQQNEDMLTPIAKKKQAEYKPSQGAALDCTPEGDSLRHQILAPVPMQIEQFDDKIIIKYEYWNAVRTIYMNSESIPDNTPVTRLGYSRGHFEGATLVIETTHVISNRIGIPGGGALFPSSDTRFIERYTYHADSDRLDLEMAIIDPVHFLKPYENQRSYLREPDWELEEFVCEAITGEY